ncbi:glycosyltransferase family 4 protein [Mesorhizobium sp.]|uniref:glycosyltransferase family 4 protein n=1 Tax=Mesorhizobium sp. TaxID=1871066 RepID=UPI000FE2FA21|nr:glycosyltransferase family 4 protein [Mesorhizobium sp.]RWN55627.1 MAG: glycosyltransferase [Mesorhizobium sp.]RWN77222.1 MAG: glycosyltransferase [Mesorhizobium sp.]RWN80239.1 MAG: glycosyltransferase [Mesorhizobium sp.]RWN86152.1 MAG: glycosyltransferase [Mesorhizobium sp.]RWO14958.1 MAG: glycosyltransferase [Mesorhizobium sp.]
MRNVANLSVLHVGSGRYHPNDRSHSTFEIWRELAKGFSRYTVVGRSLSAAATIVEGNLTIHLLASSIKRELEFLWTQRHAVELADKVAADVVVSQSAVLGGIAGAAIKRRRGCALLIEIHSDDLFADASFGSKPWLLKRLAGRVLHNADRIRVLTHRMGAAVVANYGVSLADRIAVLPPRVDLKRFDPKTDWSCSTSRLKVVVVGSVTPRKQQLRLLEVVLPQCQEIEFWIVGTGADLPACEAVVNRARAEERVRFFGQVNHTQLAGILRDADAFVLYSKSEGTPRAIMEAMAVGLPVVTTNAGYCADIIADGVEGFVLGENPDAEIVPVLARLRRDQQLRCSLGKAARARAVRDYDADILYPRYRTLIENAAR